MTNFELTIAMISMGATVKEKRNKDGSITTTYYPNTPSLLCESDLIYLIEPNKTLISKSKDL